MDARFSILQQMNLRGMVAGSAIIDYHTAPHLSPEAYVREVVAGRRFDTNLSKQLHKGFRVHNVIPQYLDGDDKTLGFGVAIVWYNPQHRPEVGTLRGRKRPRYTMQLRPQPADQHRR
jgi:hypothetical protein